MSETHGHHWKMLGKSWPIRLSLVVSFAMHLGAVYGLLSLPAAQPKEVLAITYDVAFMPAPEPEPEPAPKPPPPKPEPKPKPKPTPKPEPKPEPPKPKPKPKPEAPKPKPKPAPKPEPKPAPPEPPKPQPEVKQMAKAVESGPQLDNKLSPAWMAWARLVKRKVEPLWHVPAGIGRAENAEPVIVTFEVDREGRLLGQPKVTQGGGTPALADSAVRAILLAMPLPPLPHEFEGAYKEVQYAFSLANN